MDRTFHRLSKNNKNVVLHDSVVLDSSIVHIDSITNSISKLGFSAFEFEISVDTIADNN